jgi:hypothetical protein
VRWHWRNEHGDEGWIVRVAVSEFYSLWLNPRKDPELRKLRTILTHYALSRLVLPAENPERLRDDYVALIGVFAAKAGALSPQDNEFPSFFRKFCTSNFMRLKQRKTLGDAEWYSAIDRVFRRLFSPNSTGFTMPEYATSFRDYIRRALRGAVADVRDRDRHSVIDVDLMENMSEATHSPSSCVIDEVDFPPSIDLAATKLGVSPMTVRNWRKELGHQTWTSAAWVQIVAKWKEKEEWRKVCEQMQAGGSSMKNAKKRIERWKKQGMSLEDAQKRSAPKKAPPRNCSSCGESTAHGEVYGGKLLCPECYAEKKAAKL